MKLLQIDVNMVVSVFESRGKTMPDIIIVEDNREIGTLLCDFLRKENYTVSLVDTGEKALQIFEQYGANLVVIDIGLPGVDGYSVCSKIDRKSVV